MKKIENTFVVTGFVGNNAEIRQFTNASVARFSLAVSRQEKNGEETNRVSAFMNMEAWRKNEHVDSFDKLQKGIMLTVEGYFKPDEWVDQQGTKHNRIVFIANKFYPTPDKEEINPAKRNVLDLKNETCKNREKRNVLKISHTRHFKTTKSSPKRAAFIVLNGKRTAFK